MRRGIVILTYYLHSVPLKKPSATFPDTCVYKVLKSLGEVIVKGEKKFDALEALRYYRE